MRYLQIGAIALAAAALANAARAQDGDQESLIHALARRAGLATIAPAPPDFVRDSRPDKPTDFIPVFQPPDEPTSTIKSKAELKSMGEDLQKADAAHDNLRSAFPPSAKAVAEKKAADAAKKKGAPRPTAAPTSAAN